MAEQYPPKWVWKVMTAHYDNHRKLRFDYLEYYWRSEKSVLASLRAEGWELVRVMPIKAKTTEEIKLDKYKKIMGVVSTWFKIPRYSVDKRLTVGRAYYFKQLKKEW
jgi:hypothetical protein